MATPAETSAPNEQSNFRPLADFPSPLWGCTFASFSFPEMEFESYTRQVEELKETVKEMLTSLRKDPVQSVELINLLCRLGVSYHFDIEIDEHLHQVFDAIPNLLETNDYDLHTTALIFRVLRQHGFYYPCTIFNKFKDADGGFKESICADTKGNLSFYEAACLGIHDEEILDEALDFTRTNLESLADQSSPHLERLIKNALNHPFHKSLPRIEARQYIFFYEEDESHDETLLKLAKLDFNRLQLVHRQELSILSSWWEELNLPKQLPYARDRLVELYFWVNGIAFEPQHAHCRMMCMKFSMMVSVIDDTYDAYATIDELRLFTDAMQRCNMEAMDQLPEYMKVIYKTLLNLYNETDNEMSKEGRSHSIHYVKESFKELARAYLVEAQWSNDGYVPTFDEYVHNGLISSAYKGMITTTFVGAEAAGIDEFEWLESMPRIIKAGLLIARLINDVMSHKDEQKRAHCASGVESYMHDYGVSEEEAVVQIHKILSDAWKDIKEEWVKPSSTVPKILLKLYVNLVRVVEVIYERDDAYTKPSLLKDQVTSLLIDKLQV